MISDGCLPGMPKTLMAASIALAFMLSSGCEDGGDGFDIGDNDPNLVVCVGDSITFGYGDNGASYPSRLASMTGKAVVNGGVSGSLSSSGPGRVKSFLRQKPGAMCILYGANDAIYGHSPAAVKENIRAMIQACKANQTKPIVGTLTPQIDGHSLFNGGAMAISVEIRAVAGEEGASLVDLEKAFANHPEYYLEDGLHMSDAGNQRLAELFKGKL